MNLISCMYARFNNNNNNNMFELLFVNIGTSKLFYYILTLNLSNNIQYISRITTNVADFNLWFKCCK